jgi:hypothetical protein
MELARTQMIDLAPKRRTVESVLAQLLTPHPRFDLITSKASKRTEVETFIALRFKKIYGANIHEFMPTLLSMRCLGNLSGVAGLRPASTSQLFLEQYLDKPVELEIKNILHQSVSRDSIVEVGNLVASKTGASQIVFLMLSALLFRAGYQWLVFSATSSLVHTFKKLDFKTQLIGMADPARLQMSNQDEWGSYYESEPKVMLGSLENAMELIQQRPLFRETLRCYQDRIDALAREFKQAV